ncbi:Chaperone protein dnaJ [Coemansia interrupta]|uniref:Chaperone protein dnaJ n=1 Tax=Coemansia interrupta TaxID=1126814 RepID=A0A9W8H9A2_9FUNG|nr:Chaperone protein dnaJ [Coemansia interrupta]
MESNRDEAERALAIARQRWQAGDAAGALRLARKSHALYPSAASQTLIATYTASPPGEQPQPAGSPQPGGNHKTAAPRQPTGDGTAAAAAAAYTAEQAAAVRAVLRAPTDYYGALRLTDRTCAAAEIKRAYRRAALMFHPDKNRAPRADEAFKLVAHAFTVLSDPQRRAHYDRYGAETPQPQAHDGPARQRHRRQQQQPPDDELSPEDLFNMFFGGGIGGDMGRFGVQFGPGVRFAQQQQQRRHPQQQPQQPQDSRRAWLQLLPLLLLVLSFFASSLAPLLLGGLAARPPAYALDPVGALRHVQTTARRRVQYWVDAQELAAWQAQTPGAADVRRFEADVEQAYVARQQQRCARERQAKHAAVRRAQGWLFGLGSDAQALREAHALRLLACDELRRVLSE